MDSTTATNTSMPMRRRRNTQASNGTITMYMAVRNPARPADLPYRMPYCCRVLAVNSTMPQITEMTTGLASNRATAESGLFAFSLAPVMVTTSDAPFDAASVETALGASVPTTSTPAVSPLSALPRPRCHSRIGTKDSAPSVKRVALKNIGDIKSMPWTCATNAKPQISAVNNRLSMPTSSCLFTGRQPNVRM